MKIVSMSCPHCGASLQLDADQKNLKCDYCGNSILIDDEVKHIQLDNAEESGYLFEKGRQRAKAESTGDYNQKSNTDINEEAKKKRIWPWVLGWLLIFPIPLTILVIRNKKLNIKLKIAIIAAAWIVYLVICRYEKAEKTNKSKEDDNITRSSTYETSVDSEIIDSNIVDFKFIRDEYEVMEGKSESSSYVQVNVKDSNVFSYEDVVFKSENEDIVTVSFDHEALTTYLYFSIYGVAPGETYIYVTSKDEKVESEHIKVVVIDDGIIDPEMISIQADTTELVLGGTANLTIETTPSEATVKVVQWTSSDESVARVNEKGVVTAVGGGTTTITATVSDTIQSTCEISVDGTKRIMHVSVRKNYESDVNIGDEWSYINQIDGEAPTNLKEISVGDTIKVYSKYTESDEDPDVGEASATHVVTEEDLQNGFTITLDLYVTENGGRYSGHSAHFTITYTFSIQ